VLASTLLGADPPELPVAHLVHVASLFGINENRARVALSRMVSSGEASTDGSGRYRLAGHLLERQRRQLASRRGMTRAWDGDWKIVAVTTSGSSAAARHTRRRALTAARLAELRDGTWVRPHNLDVLLPPEVMRDVVSFTGPLDGNAPRLAASLWDLAAWNDRARLLRSRLGDLPPKSPVDLAPGFVLSAAVLRHLQSDPLLPSELLPAAWLGESLRVAYDEWDADYRRVLASWGRSPIARSQLS
jgi:phenylacetic acid degradation operon negative regulatory protein